MNFITFFFLTLLLAIGYIFYYPLQALTVLTTWHQQWREYLEGKYGEQEFKQIAEEFTSQAEALGATLDEIEKILEEQKSRITIRRGFEITEKYF